MSRQQAAAPRALPPHVCCGATTFWKIFSASSEKSWRSLSRRRETARCELGERSHLNTKLLNLFKLLWLLSTLRRGVSGAHSNTRAPVLSVRIERKTGASFALSQGGGGGGVVRIAAVHHRLALLVFLRVLYAAGPAKRAVQLRVHLRGTAWECAA